MRKEIWETPFGNAHLKIERANKHIADIDKRLRASLDTHGPSLHLDGKTGEQFLYYSLTDRYLRSDIALIVGDAIHNLKCALDFAWCDVIKRLYPTMFSNKTKFPVYPTRQDLEAALTSKREITRDSTLFMFMVEGVKCYKGGNDDLYALHRFDIDDKHDLLIPMLAVVGVEGVELEHEDGKVTRYTIMLVRPSTYRTTVPLNSKIKNHGELRFEITFGEGTLAEGQEIVPALLRFHAKVRQIVRVLQRTR